MTSWEDPPCGVHRVARPSAVRRLWVRLLRLFAAVLATACGGGAPDVAGASGTLDAPPPELFAPCQDACPGVQAWLDGMSLHAPGEAVCSSVCTFRCSSWSGGRLMAWMDQSRLCTDLGGTCEHLDGPGHPSVCVP